MTVRRHERPTNFRPPPAPAGVAPVLNYCPPRLRLPGLPRRSRWRVVLGLVYLLSVPAVLVGTPAFLWSYDAYRDVHARSGVAVKTIQWGPDQKTVRVTRWWQVRQARDRAVAWGCVLAFGLMGAAATWLPYARRWLDRPAAEDYESEPAVPLPPSMNGPAPPSGPPSSRPRASAPT